MEGFQDQKLIANAQDASALIPSLISSMIKESERRHPQIQPGTVSVMHAFAKLGMGKALLVDGVVMMEMILQILQSACPPHSLGVKWVAADGKDRPQIEISLLPPQQIPPPPQQIPEPPPQQIPPPVPPQKSPRDTSPPSKKRSRGGNSKGKDKLVFDPRVDGMPAPSINPALEGDSFPGANYPGSSAEVPQ